MQWLKEKELKELIESEENESLEKCESPQMDKIAQAVCAFSNDLSQSQKPAVILIGVKDKGGLSGLSVNDETLTKLANIQHNGNIHPFPAIDIKKLSFSSKGDVAVIQVQPSSNTPVRWRNTCYVRIGASVQKASEEQEKLLIEKRASFHVPEDMRGIADADIESDLNMEYFKITYLKSSVSQEVFESNNRDLKTQMRSLRLLDKNLKPTVTAILIMGVDPLRWLPGAFIQFIRFEGDKLTDPVKNQQEISGSLPDQIRRIEEVLKLNISTPLSLSDTTHIQSPDYPMTALSQLVRNAVLHRNYKSHTPVKIHWFKDRIEIISPGGPCGEVSVKNFSKEGFVSYRNPTIATALKNLGFVERFGFGIPQARKALKENNNPELQLKAEGERILAVVKRSLQ